MLPRPARAGANGWAVVSIEDDLGNTVAGATTHGEFSGDITETGLSGATDAGGTAIIESTGTAQGKVNLTFCVTDVVHATLSYTQGAVCASN